MWQAVDALGAALGEGVAFGEELHHRREHSIELAAAWLHWGLRRCGRQGRLRPAPAGAASSAAPSIPTSRRAAPSRRAIRCWPGRSTPWRGPSAGARPWSSPRPTWPTSAPPSATVAPLDGAAREALARSDDDLLGPALSGSAGGFLEALRAGCDRTRVCGLPPTYWTLRLLERLDGGPLPGRLTGYQQCPAGEAFGSVVSIAGILWRVSRQGAVAPEGPAAGGDSAGSSRSCAARREPPSAETR